MPPRPSPSYSGRDKPLNLLHIPGRIHLWLLLPSVMALGQLLLEKSGLEEQLLVQFAAWTGFSLPDHFWLGLMMLTYFSSVTWTYQMFNYHDALFGQQEFVWVKIINALVLGGGVMFLDLIFTTLLAMLVAAL